MTHTFGVIWLGDSLSVYCGCGEWTVTFVPENLWTPHGGSDVDMDRAQFEWRKHRDDAQGLEVDWDDTGGWNWFGEEIIELTFNGDAQIVMTRGDGDPPGLLGSGAPERQG